MRILPAGVDARDVLLCQWLQVAHRGWARNARRNTIPAPAISPRALSRFPVSDAVVAGLTDSDRTPWARMLPSVIGIRVRLIEASAPLRERASAGISDPYAGDVDHPPTSVHVLGLRGREPGADQFGDEPRPKAVRQ